MQIIDLRGVLIKNMRVQAASHVASLALGLAMAAVLSRHLGVEGYGQFNYVFAFFYFFLTLNDFGVDIVVLREISQQRERAGQIIGAMLSFKVLLAAVWMLTVWTVIAFMGFQGELRTGLMVYALILPIVALQLPGAIFRALLKMEYPSVIGFFNRCMALVLVVVVAWLGYGLVGLISALVTVELISLLVMLRYARRYVTTEWRFDLRLWRTVLRSSVPIAVATMLTAVINRIDFLMLERMTNLTQVGLYAAAYKITNLLEAFPQMIMATMYPLMSRYATTDAVSLRGVARQSRLILATAAVPVGLGVTLLGPLVIRLLFGDAYAEAGLALQILIWSTVCIYMAITGGSLLIALGREKLNLAILGVAATINVGLNLFWIPRWGFLGAASATTVTYIVILVWTTIRGQNRAGRGLVQRTGAADRRPCGC